MNMNGNYTNSWTHGYGSQPPQHQLFYTTMNHQPSHGYYQPHIEKTNFYNVISTTVGFSNHIQQRNHHTMPASTSSGYINLREHQRNRYPHSYNKKQQNFKHQHYHQQQNNQQQQQQQQQQNNQNMSNNHGIINGLKNFVNGFINPTLNCNFYTDHQRNYNPKYRNNFIRNEQIDNMQNQQHQPNRQPVKHSQNILEPHVQTVFFNLTVEPKIISTQLTSTTMTTNIKKPTETLSSVDEVDHCHRSTEKSDNFTIFTLDDFPELPVPKQKINISIWNNDDKTKESCPFYTLNGNNSKNYNNKNKINQNKKDSNKTSNQIPPTIDDDDDTDNFNDNNDSNNKNDSFSSTNIDNVQQERQRKESECDSEDSFIIFTNQSPSNYDKIINYHINNKDNHNYNAGTTPFRPTRTRERQISECSDDSFIICFTDDAAEGVIEYSDGITSSDDDSDTDYDTDDDDDENDDDINKKLNNNQKTENNNDDVLSTNDGGHCSQPDSGFDEHKEKKVRFNLNLEIHTMHTWSYAYRAARKGHWETYVRDRSRFSDRIKYLSSILNPILDSKHRENVYKLRFCDKNNTNS